MFGALALCLGLDEVVAVCDHLKPCAILKTAPRARAGAQFHPMLLHHTPRSPAPFLACRGVRLRLHVRPNAFGNALGNSIVGQISQASQQAEKVRAAATAKERAEIMALFEGGPNVTPVATSYPVISNPIESRNLPPSYVDDMEGDIRPVNPADLPEGYPFKKVSPGRVGGVGKGQGGGASAIAAGVGTEPNEPAYYGNEGRRTVVPETQTEKMMRLARMSNRTDLSAEQYHQAAQEYKQLMGKDFNRDSIYNGLWTKGAQLDIQAGKMDRSLLDHTASVAIEAGMAGDAGTAMARAAGKAAGGGLSTAMQMVTRKPNVVTPEVSDTTLGGTGKTADGLAYRVDLPQHLVGPDGFTKSGQLSGTHNLDNATTALDAKGAKYSLTPTGTQGISELQYSYVNSANGKVVSGTKTVYDPAIITDKAMVNYALKAGDAGWSQYLANPAMTPPIYNVKQGGVNFRVYINVDKNGQPFVGNVHPIK
ncbi:MAG: CdiA family toxin C-terminal domain-containing protein [Burkholderiaceae bacterium]